MELTSSAFSDGERILRRYTGDGENISPPLEWTGAPEGTRSFTLICEDPDAPARTWQHWAVYDVPAERRGLREHFPRTDGADGPHQAQNNFHRAGYDGPLPPAGHGAHRYVFRLFAVSAEKLALGLRPSCVAVAREAQKRALAVAELTGTYER